MKKIVAVLLLLSSPCIITKDKDKSDKKPVARRQRIINNSSYPIRITLLQEGKRCKKTKEWTIEPKKEKKIFMWESCYPVSFTLRVPDEPKIKFNVDGKQAGGYLVFSTVQGIKTPEKFLERAQALLEAPSEEGRYLYWTVTINGKKEPLKVKATSYDYSSRKRMAARSVTIPTDIALGIVTLGILPAVAKDQLGYGMVITGGL